MTRPRLWKVLVPAAVVVAVAGTAAALLVTGRHEVTTTSEEAYEVYLRGRENERRMYHREAMADYGEALAHDPEFLMATVRLARSVAGKDPERARMLLSCAGSRRDAVTAREQLLYDIAYAALTEKEPKKAQELVDRYRREYPDDPEGYEMRANYLLRQGKADEAIREYELLLERNPNYAVAYNQLGYYSMERKEWARAEDYLKRYRFLAPDQANPYDSLGELYANTGRYEEAEASLRKALEVKPDFWASLGHLGTVHAARGEWREAAGFYARTAEQAVDKDALGFVLAEAASLALAGEWPAAEAKFEAMRAELEPQAPPGPEAKANGFARRVEAIRAVSLIWLKRLDEAEDPVRRVLEMEAAAPGLKKEGRSTGELLAALRDAARGRPDGLSSVVADGHLPPVGASAGGGWDYFPYRPVVWVLSARLLAENGRVGEAADVVKGVLAVNPRFAPAVETLAAVKGEGKAAALGAPGSSPHGGR